MGTENVLDKNIHEFEYGGKTYKLTERTFSDIALFRNHIRTTRLKEILSATAGMSIDERSKLITNYQKTALSDEDVQSEISTTDGMIFMIWCSFKENYPEVTIDMVSKMSVDKPEEMVMLYYVLTGVDVEELTQIEDKGKNAKGATEKK